MLQTFSVLACPSDLLASLGKLETSLLDASASSTMHAFLPPAASSLGGNQRLALGTRRWNTRDLFKWCVRVDAMFKDQGASLGTDGISIEEHIFAEALDCFAASVPCIRTRTLLLCWLAQVWKLPSDRVEYHVRLYKPSVSISRDFVKIGRISSLVRNEKLSVQLASSVHGGGAGFSHTMHSSRLLEKLAACIARNEPLLLVGETGNGKTTIIQHLAQQCGRNLVVQNLNQQTDSSDFLGGFKPVELRLACLPLMREFGHLFPKSFSSSKNRVLTDSIKHAFDHKNWKTLINLWRQAIQLIEMRHASSDGNVHLDSTEVSSALSPDSIHNLKRSCPSNTYDSSSHADSVSVSGKRSLSVAIRDAWQQFAVAVSAFERQFDHLKSNFAFQYIEGSLVKAMREGSWILLDEVNLATSETLERLSGVLDGGSLVLLERGDAHALPRHPDFRLLASMNPPTDFGKKDLPAGIRNKMTELYVDEVRNRGDLCVIVNAALRDRSSEAVAAKVRFPLFFNSSLGRVIHS